MKTWILLSIFALSLAAPSVLRVIPCEPDGTNSDTCTPMDGEGGD